MENHIYKVQQVCSSCGEDGILNENGLCEKCLKLEQEKLSDTKSSAVEPKLDLTYAKSLGLNMTDEELADTITAKFVGPDQIYHRIFLWGNEEKPDLSKEFFTKDTNFWDAVFKNSPRPLTWDHAQDATMKANPIIGKTVEWGDDEIGRWALSHLDRSHRYRKGVEALIKSGVIGTSSDTAPQYVEREKRGKSTWLKSWPWFAAALTDVPCEHRMVGTVEYFKSLGLELPSSEVPEEQVRSMVERAHRLFKNIDVFGA